MINYIINADDFGQTLSCTKAIKEAMECGWITDTTMVSNGEKAAFDLAVKLALSSPAFAGRVGIHFNLTEGTPLTQGMRSFSEFVKDNEFSGKVNRQRLLSRYEKEAVYRELNAQVKRLKECGISISHADSHHHIHTAVFIAPIVMRVCRENSITKIRLHRNVGVSSIVKKVVKTIFNRCLLYGFTTTDYFGSAKDMVFFTKDGITEIMVHPDYNADGELIDRTGYESGYPVGELLDKSIEKYLKKKTSYEVL